MFARIFQIDYRSMAAFRIGLATLLLLNLLETMKSDFGLVLGLHALSAAMLLIGYHTRLMTGLCCILIWIASIQTQINTDAQLLIQLLIFWGMFLPLGARWSVDSALSPSKAQGSLSDLCSMAMLLQILMVYFFGGILPFFSIDVGYVCLLSLGLIMSLSPFKTERCRMLAIIGFAVTHYWFILMLENNLFHWVSLCAWLVFIPGIVWQGLASSLRREGYRNIQIYYDGDCGFCKKCVLILIELMGFERDQIQPAQNHSTINDTMQFVNSWVVRNQHDEIYTEFEAGLVLSRSWWILDPITTILKFAPIFLLGNWCYRRVANNRQKFGLLTKHLRIQPIHLKNAKILQLLATLMIMIVILCHLLNINNRYQELSQKLALQGIIKIICPNENWRNSLQLFN